MELSRTPLPRPKVVFLALRAYTAAVELRNARARVDEWRSLCEAFNTVNALDALGKVTPRLEPESLWSIHRALSRTSVNLDTPIEVDDRVMAPMAEMVSVYDRCLQKLARRTIEEALDLIDYSIVRSEMLDGQNDQTLASRPPMLTGLPLA